MGVTQHNKGNKVTWEEYRHYLWWAFVFGLALTFWCNCAPGIKVDHASWDKVKLVRLARAVLDEGIRPKAAESQILCWNIHGNNQMAMQICMQNSPAFQAHFAWKLIGRKIVRNCVRNAVLDLVIAERTKSKVQIDSHLDGCRCLLQQFDKKWGAVLSREKRKVVQRAVQGVVCKGRWR